MARKGHKEDCQCAVCRGMRAKAAQPVVEPMVEPGVPFCEIKVGALFKYPVKLLGGHLYRKVWQGAGALPGKAMDLTASGIGDDPVKFESSARVLPK